MSKYINISALPKDEVLAALYNASQRQGLGVLQPIRNPMTALQASVLLMSNDRQSFDYLYGKVLKLNLHNDSTKEGLFVGGYDRDNGEGAAAKALAPLFVSAGQA